MSTEGHKEPFPPPPPLPKLINVSWPWVFGCLAALALFYFGGKEARKQFALYKYKKVKANALAFYENKDLTNAFISAQEALKNDSDDLAILRILAELAELANSPGAIIYRAHVAQLKPNDTNLFALARSALKNEELSVADQALQSLPSEAKTSAAYHELAGTLFLKLKNPDQAQIHFQKASESNPQNQLYKFNILALQLDSGGPKRVQARAELEQMAQDPKFREIAVQQLMNVELREKKFDEVSRWGQFLKEHNSLGLDSRLMLFAGLKAGDSNVFRLELQKLQAQVGTNSAEVYKVMQWLNQNNLPEATIAWGTTLPDFQKAPLSFCVANAYLQLGQWANLDKFLNRSEWGPMKYVKSAFAARAARQLGDRRGSVIKAEQAQWDAGANTDALYALGDLFARWGWNKETEECWWTIARGSFKQRVALQKLYRLYRDANSAKNLYRVVERIYEVNRKDPPAINNFAYLSMVLNQNVDMAATLAEQNLKLFPDHSSFIATQCLALVRKKKYGEAADLVEKIPDNDRENPQIAFIVAVTYFVSDNPKAAQFYQKAVGGKALMPEEEILLEQIRDGQR